MLSSSDIQTLLKLQFELRNQITARFIAPHSEPLARVCREMSERFLKGGRLLAIGCGPSLTDAQHVSVEFVHPVIVGKRALPALDLSCAPEAFVQTLARPDDIVMSFEPPEGMSRLDPLVESLQRRGTLVCRWPGRLGEFPLEPASRDPFVHQETTELMYHTLWETVHVFFEQNALDDDVGASAFLYPFLSKGDSAPGDVLADVAASIRQKGADDNRLRDEFAVGQSEAFSAAVAGVRERLARGGTILAFGNGGSATDANDFVLDCVEPPEGMAPVPAISLSMEPANISAISNDVGVELVFMRQLIANGRPADVAVAISTSGKSKNICQALAEAKKRGLLTLALLGSDGGDIVRERLADHVLVVHSDYIPRIQEVQASIYHVFRRALCD